MNIEFKNVMKAFDYAEKNDVNKIINCLIPDLEINQLDVEEKINLSNEIFRSLQKEEKKGSGKKTIDFKKDYRLIWDSFKAKRNIDLNKDKINWWEFISVLEGLFLEGDNSISKVVEFRTTKIPKVDKYNKDYVEFLREMKSKYKLVEEDNTNKGLRDLYNYLKNRAGEK